MSENLESKIDELEKLLLNSLSTKVSPIEKSSKYIHWIQSIVALIIIVIGMGITWGLTQGRISTLENEVTSLKQSIVEDHLISKTERDKMHTELIGMQVKQAAVDQLMTSIREDITEIKEDVKKLTRGR